ncbi:glycosyltransferase involved in cell wall biosynthesis [Stackebrandtia endophytica]|uniref:Glycosyltransferase involved in cell wall biosynthesis n=2 Tax=Stackebrandtia endophytica TaxID=1496996 RepID=A0A543AZK9_9ACTN|nr:glycosyltransferase involved in cell wall biosynthesis [Stackebrandtia endophytica]
MKLYELAAGIDGPSQLPARDQEIHTQLALQAGIPITGLLERYQKLSVKARTSLEMDRTNPFTGDGDPDAWTSTFQRLFTDPVPIVADGDATPFDRLATEPVKPVDVGPVITVVVTSYCPDHTLVTAVKSICHQTWQNLEVLIVDDGSGDDYIPILEQAQAIDERVRLIRLDQNGGTYRARNAAFDAATGEFVTIQDSDDWSHPRRLEQQVAPLLRDEQLMATTSDGLKVTENLMAVRVGRAAIEICTASLMFRRRVVMDRIGYLDEVRKAADTEFCHRIKAAFGSKAVKHLKDQVHTVIRLSPVSLSRAEFQAGWMHPARAAYRSAYGLWHEDIRGGADSYLPKHQINRRFFAPPHFLGAIDKRSYDVVFAADWRAYGGPQKSMIEEITALTDRGLRVAVTHFEAFRFMTIHRKPLCTPVQRLINSGVVDQVLPTDDVDIDLLILRYPPILQFAGGQTHRLRPNKLIILGNQAPAEDDGTDQRYVPRTCDEAAAEWFGTEAIWCPQGPTVRTALSPPALEPSKVASFDMPGIIDASSWSVPRTGFRGPRPIIGRHSRDHWTKWPAGRGSLLTVYPDSPNVDVRFMGGATTARALLDGEDLPLNWVAYDYDEVSVPSFLHQLDFYVYFPHPKQIEAFGRTILEALAAGCVTLLPHHFANTFGEGAIYCTPDEVPSLIDKYYSDEAAFLRQSHTAREQVERRYSHQSYYDLITTILKR